MLEIEIKEDNKKTTVHLKGPINEESGKALTDLHTKVEKTIIFDFSKVDYVNSLGIRSWINFLRHIQENREIYFENCTPDIVMQMNMMSHFKGSAKILSFYGEYSCRNCGNEELIKFENTENGDLYEKIQNQDCSRCGHILTLEEDDESYLHFLD